MTLIELHCPIPCLVIKNPPYFESVVSMRVVFSSPQMVLLSLRNYSLPSTRALRPTGVTHFGFEKLSLGLGPFFPTRGESCIHWGRSKGYNGEMSNLPVKRHYYIGGAHPDMCFQSISVSCLLSLYTYVGFSSLP